MTYLVMCLLHDQKTAVRLEYQLVLTIVILVP